MGGWRRQDDVKRNATLRELKEVRGTQARKRMVGVYYHMFELDVSQSWR